MQRITTCRPYLVPAELIANCDRVVSAGLAGLIEEISLTAVTCPVSLAAYAHLVERYTLRVVGAPNRAHDGSYVPEQEGK